MANQNQDNQRAPNRNEPVADKAKQGQRPGEKADPKKQDANQRMNKDQKKSGKK